MAYGFNEDKSRAEVKTADELLDFFYPIGSFYETSDSDFDPNISWGGSWELEAEGKVHIGAGSNYVTGSTGGSNDAVVVEHTHQVAAVNIPSSGGHTHTIQAKYNSNALASGSARVQFANDGDSTSSLMASIPSNTGTHTHTVPQHSTKSTGSSGAGKNMQAYVAVNRWHRVA